MMVFEKNYFQILKDLLIILLAKKTIKKGNTL